MLQSKEDSPSTLSSQSNQLAVPMSTRPESDEYVELSQEKTQAYQKQIQVTHYQTS